MDNKEKKQQLKEFLIVVIFVTLFFIVPIIIITSYNSKQKIETSIISDEYQASLQIPGYELDTPFDLETYEYNVKVDMDEIQIICNFFEDVKGCNQKINMSDKDSYDHIIEINENGVVKKYTIHFQKEITSKDENIRITSIEGIPDKWTNQDVKIVINVESKEKEGILYSFNDGKTWQLENEFKVSTNQELSIIVKDKNDKRSDVKKVIINKIDKDKPKVELMIESKSKDNVIIKAIGGDKTSEIDKYKFNDDPYSATNLFVVNKAGVYSVVVKDKAGNISEESSIKIEENDFINEAAKQFDYKIKLEKNGSDFESTTLTCKSLTKNCKITLPKIKRNNGTSLGWSKSKNSKTADYKAGDIIEVKEDITLYAITYENLVATLKSNGATSIGDQSKSCIIYNNEDKCTITLPTITRNSGVVLGWSHDKNSQTASYKINDTITLKKDTNLYAITYKNLRASFNKNGADSIGDTSKICKLYNTDTTCEVTAPTITRKGWSDIGWHTEKTAKKALVNTNSPLKISKNVKYYAITSKLLTVTFNKNGADSIGANSDSCKIYNTETMCEINTPSIIRNGGEVIGWSTMSNAKSKHFDANSTAKLKKDINYYAITSKTLTATLEKGDATSISETSKSCDIYNNEKSCSVKLPLFTNTGRYNLVWKSSNKECVAGKTCTIDGNIVFKATNLHPYHDSSYNSNSYKERNVSIQTIYNKGNTVFEYETGIPKDAVNQHIAFLDELYKIMPYLFNPGKVFVFTEESYSKLSSAGGLTHYSGFYFLIDLKYKNTNKEISENATIHELSHGWDGYYAYKKGKRISEQNEVKNLYNSHLSNIHENYSNGSYNEFFAATVTNYYWFILEKDLNINYGVPFIYKSGFEYSSSDKEKVINIINKYKNG